MTIDCNNCKEQVTAALSAVPKKWRDSLASAICDSVVGNNSQIDCAAINECVEGTFGNTNISNFTIDGTTVSITYTDIEGVTVTRTFNFNDILNNSLDGIDPKCLASVEDWTAMTYKQKWETIIDRVCEECQEFTSTTTTTTV